ncbi:hypothetical protein M211_1038 [Acinetobacter lactucae]|nr:hypothetical protein M211_1038 [Acinetobacter lactucae]
MWHSFYRYKILVVSEILFWEKKSIAKPIKTVLGTSQVLLLLSFSRDDLKPENL